ncbi:MAG: ATP-binding protein, partial [Lachnospiraceae bacterium]|nr:ATP-binding protein [Lachnospiraceae bacterium]
VILIADSQARQFLRQRKSFVWEATSITDLPVKHINLFRSYNAYVKIVFLETQWQENLQRNAKRAACCAADGYR